MVKWRRLLELRVSLHPQGGMTVRSNINISIAITSSTSSSSSVVGSAMKYRDILIMGKVLATDHTEKRMLIADISEEKEQEQEQEEQEEEENLLPVSIEETAAGRPRGDRGVYIGGGGSFLSCCRAADIG
jgi:hypothetical protein